MLSSAMVEGQTKRVAVRDTPKAAMELFLEIVYTGCVSAEEEDDGDDATEESDESADTDAAASSSAATGGAIPAGAGGGRSGAGASESQRAWPASAP